LVNYEYTLISVLLFITTLVALITAVILWPRRNARGVLWLILLEIAAAVWTLGIAFESAATTIPLKYFWSKIAYLGTNTVSPFFFLFAYEYSQQHKISSYGYLILLFLPAIFANILAFTNGVHHLIWTNLTIDPVTNLGLYAHGMLFWILVIGGSYLLLVVGLLFLLKALYQFSPIYRTPNTFILFAALIPFTGSIISNVGFCPLKGLDLAPPAFILSGVLLSWSLLRFNLFKLIPVARNRIIDTMSDGVVILNDENRIIDSNPSAQYILGISVKSTIGKRLIDLLPGQAQLEDILSDNKNGFCELQLNYSNQQHYFEVKVTSLSREITGDSGKSVLFHDITERKVIELEREKLVNDLRNALSEVKTLHGLLPICSHCKKIRNDQGYWQHVEEYVRQHSEAEFSHGICPDCMAKLYPEQYERIQKRKSQKNDPPKEDQAERS
jgi:PAS domain S-box-containing protein